MWLGRGENSCSSGDVEAFPTWSSRCTLLGAWAESTGHRRVTLLRTPKLTPFVELWVVVCVEARRLI